MEKTYKNVWRDKGIRFKNVYLDNSLSITYKIWSYIQVFDERFSKTVKWENSHNVLFQEKLIEKMLLYLLSKTVSPLFFLYIKKLIITSTLLTVYKHPEIQREPLSNKYCTWNKKNSHKQKRSLNFSKIISETMHTTFINVCRKRKWRILL